MSINMCVLEGLAPVYTLFKMRSVPGGQVQTGFVKRCKYTIVGTPSDHPGTKTGRRPVHFNF